MRSVLAVTVLLIPGLSLAQAPATIKLQPPDARLETGFTAITSIRELSDGRIIVSDPRDLQLVIADFRTGDVQKISRQGGGPGEYRMAAPVHAIAGDSSLLSDFQLRRVLLLDKDKVVATGAPDDAIIKATQGFIRFADRLGNVYSTKSPDVPDGQTVSTSKDSSAVLRVNRGTGRLDTLTKLLDRPVVRTINRNAKGEISMSSVRSMRLRVGEQFAVHPDGWIAVTRINPFCVDWRPPDGRWITGAPLPIPVIRMNDREKQASLARTAASMAANPSSTPLPPQLQTPDDEWPDVMPPFLQGEMTFTPEGHILLRRQPSANFPGVAYYAIDRRGALAGIIEMKDNERIFAFGARSIYVIETDADDLRFIRRHPWPFTNRPG